MAPGVFENIKYIAKFLEAWRFAIFRIQND